jgi:hypothetical protein
MTPWKRMFKEKRKHRVPQLLKLLEESKKDATIKIAGYDYDTFGKVTSALLQFLVPRDGISDVENWRLLRGAITDVGKSTTETLTVNSLSKSFNDRIQNRNTLPNLPFTFVSSIHSELIESLSAQTYRGHYLKHSTELEPKFIEGHQDTKKYSKTEGQFYPAGTESYFSTEIVATNAEEAFFKGVRLRNIWLYSLLPERAKLSRIFAEKNQNRPLFFVRPGITSMFDENGDLDTTTYGYTVYGNAQAAGTLKLAKDDYLVLEQNSSQTLQYFSMKSADYQTFLEDAACLYVDALCAPVWELTYLLLWQLVEKLTGVKQGERDMMKKVRTRILSLCDGKHFHEPILTSLSDYRSKYVHSGQSSPWLSDMIFNLIPYVEVLQLFHMQTQISTVEQGIEILESGKATY